LSFSGFREGVRPKKTARPWHVTPGLLRLAKHGSKRREKGLARRAAVPTVHREHFWDTDHSEQTALIIITRQTGGDTMNHIEQRTMKKVFRHLVPFLMFCYFFNFLDRVNVSFAALDMNRDLGFSASQAPVAAELTY
jgi:hypothetical protein